jgi:hypothetical protein
MTLPPPVPPTPPLAPSVKPWWQRLPAIVGLAVGILLVIATLANSSKRNTPADNGRQDGIELCAALRDSENDNLTTGDWEQLTGWREWKIVEYVTENCPEEARRFGG